MFPTNAITRFFSLFSIFLRYHLLPAHSLGKPSILIRSFGNPTVRMLKIFLMVQQQRARELEPLLRRESLVHRPCIFLSRLPHGCLLLSIFYLVFALELHYLTNLSLSPAHVFLLKLKKTPPPFLLYMQSLIYIPRPPKQNHLLHRSTLPLHPTSLYVKRLQGQCTNTTRLHSSARSPPQHLRFTLDR